MWHSPIVDFFRMRVPFDSHFRVYAKRLVEDTRSLMRWSVPWRHLEMIHPPRLALETTNICNANCVFCAYQFQDKFRHGKGVMSHRLFDVTLKQHRDFGGRSVNFTPLVGDALVDPHIAERVRVAKEMGFFVGFFTNGILLHRLDLEAFLKTGIDSIVLSTGPFEKGSYELLYRTNQYENMINGVRKLLVLRNALDAPMRLAIQFRSHIPQRALLELKDYRERIFPLLSDTEKRNVYVQIKGFDTWGGQIRKENLPGIMNVAYPPLIKRRPCIWTFSPMVLWDGQVRACACSFAKSERRNGDDGLFIGRLPEESLKDIWKGKRVRALRRRFLTGDLPAVCLACTQYRSC